MWVRAQLSPAARTSTAKIRLSRTANLAATVALTLAISLRPTSVRLALTATTASSQQPCPLALMATTAKLRLSQLVMDPAHLDLTTQLSSTLLVTPPVKMEAFALLASTVKLLSLYFQSSAWQDSTAATLVWQTPKAPAEKAMSVLLLEELPHRLVHSMAPTS